MVGAERNFAGFGLSGGAADVGGLEAVGDRVAHEVHKRVGNLLNDAVVQFGFAAGEIELDLLPGGSGGGGHGSAPPRVERAAGPPPPAREFTPPVVRPLREPVGVPVEPP